jgi:hypothetical protein
LSEIKKLCEKENRFTAIDADIVIAHPACEINRDFLSLGFRETVIINEKPVERNLYLISTNNDYILHDKPVLELHDIKIIFDIRERWLTNIADRWDKLRLIRFVKNPEAPKGLYKEIKRTLKEYIEFQNEAHYGLIAAWIMATYFNRCFHAFPFIFFYGKKQSGKSRALDVLERVVFNAMKVKGVSVAAMADSIDGVCGTFLNDQAEVLSDSRNVEILGILADSYTRGGGKRRIVSLANNSRKVVEFETYSPKAFASIKEIDADLKDRCIMYPMLRTKGDYPYPDAHLPIWKNLRDKLYRYLLCKWEEADEIYQTAGEDVTQRVRELWKPIETMLMLEHVPQMEMKAVKAAFLESMLETQTELSDYEESFFKVLLTMLKHTGGKGIFAVNEIAVHLKKGRDMTDKGIQTWTGRIISQFSLYDKHAGRRKYYDDQDRIRKGRAYYFSYDHVKDVYDRYQQTGGTGGQVGKKAKEKGNDHLTTKTTGYEPTKKEKFSNCVKMMRKLRGLGYEIKLDYSGADFNVLYSGKVTRGYGKGRILIKLLKKNKKMVVKKLKRETQQGNK